MITKTEKIKDENKISISLEEDNIEVMIRYPKQSTLKRRKELLIKLQEILKNS